MCRGRVRGHAGREVHHHLRGDILPLLQQAQAGDRAGQEDCQGEPSYPYLVSFRRVLNKHFTDKYFAEGKSCKF